MCNLVELIRVTMIQNEVRNYAYLDLMRILGVPKPKAKRLVFAWMYRATEEKLQSILKEENYQHD